MSTHFSDLPGSEHEGEEHGQQQPFVPNPDDAFATFPMAAKQAIYALQDRVYDLECQVLALEQERDDALSLMTDSLWALVRATQCLQPITKAKCNETNGVAHDTKPAT